MAATFRENYATVFITGLVISAILALIVYAIG